MTYRSLLLSYYNIDTISYQGVLLSTVIVEPSQVVTLTHSTIQNDWTALQLASAKGHHKVVEVLLGAGANPDLQDKVRTGQDSGVLVKISNGFIVSYINGWRLILSNIQDAKFYIADCKSLLAQWMWPCRKL